MLLFDHPVCIKNLRRETKTWKEWFYGMQRAYNIILSPLSVSMKTT